LGTSAAHSCPLPFCNCNVCDKARKSGGRNLRKRSSLLINEDLVIDIGQDFMSASFMHGVDTTKIRYWLQTHSHSDHFSPAHIITRMSEYASKNIKPLSLFASSRCIQHMSEQLGQEESGASLLEPKWLGRLNLEVTNVNIDKEFKCGPYSVTALHSAHDTNDDSYLYLVDDNSCKLFYGLDADEQTLMRETIDYFSNNCIHLNVVVLDHTYGDIGSCDHLNTKQFIAVIGEMEKSGIVDKETKIFASHISHEGVLSHDDFVLSARQNGYDVAFDGLEIEINYIITA